jgi:hypothetical protein
VGVSELGHGGGLADSACASARAGGARGARPLVAGLAWPVGLLALFPSYFSFSISYYHFYSTPWAPMHVYMCCQAHIHPCGVH